MKKILFLDFDGVLNNNDARRIYPICGFHSRHLNNEEFRKNEFNFVQRCLDSLNYLIGQVPDLITVISSNWRFESKIENFKKLFDLFEIKYNSIDMIPQHTRGNDFYKRSFLIIEYLNKYYDNLNEIKYVAVDDRKDLFHSDFKNVVFTNPELGLTNKDVDDIIFYLR